MRRHRIATLFILLFVPLVLANPDVNSDGSVDILDLVAVVSNFGSADPAHDLNGDGSVDVLDLIFIVNNFGPAPTTQDSLTEVSSDASSVTYQATFSSQAAWHIITVREPSNIVRENYEGATSPHPFTLPKTTVEYTATINAEHWDSQPGPGSQAQLVGQTSFGQVTIPGTGNNACLQDVTTCPDGSTVGRNPNDNCNFFPCPTTSPPATYTCGQNGCESALGETCSNCAQDCGTCQVPPVGGSSAWGPGTNEPAGFSPLMDWDGTTKNFATMSNFNWVFIGKSFGDINNPNEQISCTGGSNGKGVRVHIIPENTPSGFAMESNYCTGDGPGFAGMQKGKWATVMQPQELYIRYYIKFHPQWQQHGSGVTKQFYYGFGSSGKVTQMYPQFRGSSGHSLGLADQSGSNSGDVEYRNCQNGAMYDGQWHEIEILHKLEDTGQSNGGVRVWIDGNELSGCSQVRQQPKHDMGVYQLQFHDGRADNYFNGLEFGTFWGGNGDQKTQNDWVRWGGMYISGK